MPETNANILTGRGGLPKYYTAGTNAEESLTHRLSRDLGIPAVVFGINRVALLDSHATCGVKLTYEEAGEILNRQSLDGPMGELPPNIRNLMDASNQCQETALRIDLNARLNARWTESAASSCSRWFQQPARAVEWTIHLHAGPIRFAWDDVFAALNRLKSMITDMAANNVPRPGLAIYGWPDSDNKAALQKFVGTGAVLHPVVTADSADRFSAGHPDRKTLESLADFGLRVPTTYLVEAESLEAALTTLRVSQTITKMSGFSVIPAAAWPFFESLLNKQPQSPKDYAGLLLAIEADDFLSDGLLEPSERLDLLLKYARSSLFISVVLDENGCLRTFHLVPSPAHPHDNDEFSEDLPVHPECAVCVLQSLCGGCDAGVDGQLYRHLCVQRSGYILRSLTDCLELTKALPSRQADMPS